MPIPNFDIYLKLTGFQGEVTARGHRDEIEVLSYEQGIAVPAPTGGPGGAGGAGRATFSPVRFRKPLDRATPPLMVACASGQHIQEARFAFVRVGGNPMEFYRVTLTDVVITGITQIAGDGAQYPLSFRALDSGNAARGILEEIALGYGTITWEYWRPTATGQVGPPVKTGWDVAANQRV